MVKKSIFIKNINLLTAIVFAIAFVVLLMTLYPYQQINSPKTKITKNQFTCPTSDWIDCMPGPGPARTQCSSEYLRWAKDNCPNFKGVAY